MKAALIALALIAVVAVIVTMQVSKKNIEVRRELLAMEGCRKVAAERLDAIQKSFSNTTAIADQADEYVPVASNLVVALLGQDAFPKPPKPVAPAQPRSGGAPGASPRVSEDNPGGLMTKEEIERRRGAGTAGAPQAPPARRADPPPRPPPEPPQEAGKVTEDNPAGLMTREQLERRRAGGGREPAPKPAPEQEAAREPARPVAAPPAPAPAPVAQPVIELAKPVGPQEPIMIMFRQLLSQVGTIRETAQKAGEICAQAESLNEDVLNAKASSNAVGKVEALEPLVGDAAKLRETALSQLEGIKKKCAEIGREKVRVEEERRARAEAERKRLEEEARRALVAAEIQRGGEAHRAVLPAIRKFQFADALQTAKGIQEQMKTEEGRKATQPAIDLCTRLAAFKRFLIERLSADPFKWGWGEGGAARDIVGANDEGVKHSTGFASWPDVGIKQLVRIIERYVNDEKLGAKVRGESCLGAALLLRDLEAADQADLFARRAAQHMPSLEGEFIRLK